MSKPRTLESKTIPFPSDGLNLIAAPDQFLPTEARILDNYFIFDWGIRERSKIYTVNTPDGNNIISMVQYFDSSNAACIFLSTTANTYKLSNLFAFLQLNQPQLLFIHVLLIKKYSF